MAQEEENLLDYRVQNKRMKESLVQSINEMFPITANGKTLRLENLKFEDNLSDTDFPQQRKSKIDRKS